MRRKRREEYSRKLEAHLPAKMDFDPNFMEHCGLDGQRLSRGRSVRSIGNADMVCPVPRHHRIARDAMENGAYQGPLRGSALPAAARLLGRQFDDSTQTDIGMQRTI